MRWTRARSFRRSLIINLLLIVIVFGATVAGISYVVMQVSARRSSEALMTQVVDGLGNETQAFFGSVESIFTLVEFWAHRTWTGAWDTYEFDRTFAPMLLAFYEASSIYLSQGSGDFYMLSRAEGQWLSWTVRPVAWGDRALVRTWTDQNPVPDERWQKLDFDVTKLPWFTGALARLEAGSDAPLARRVYTAAPAVAPTTGIPGQAISMVTTSPLGEPFVFCFERSLVGVTQRLADTQVLDGGRVALLSGQPDRLVMIGVPLSGAAVDEAAADRLILQPPAALGGPIAAFVEAAAGNEAALREPLRFSEAGDDWWGMVYPVQAKAFDVPAEPAWIVAVIPESDLLRRLPHLELPLAAATLLAGLLAVLRARSLAGSFSRPIDDLVEHSRRMQRLDFEQSAKVSTNIVEIGILGDTLEGMRRALHSYVSISEETRIAEAIVRGTLPSSLRRPSGYEIEALWRPAAESGGQIFDVLPVDRPGGEATALMLLDPDSFGVEAAVLSAQLRAVFRASARSGESPVGMAAELQRCLEDDLRDAGTVRAWIAVLDPASGTVTAVAAGLGGNMIVRSRGSTAPIEALSPDPSLGSQSGWRYRQESIHLQPEDCLVIASHGVIEALDGNRQRFGIRGIDEALAAVATESAAVQVKAIDAAVDRFATNNRFTSDRTLILVKRLS